MSGIDTRRKEMEKEKEKQTRVGPSLPLTLRRLAFVREEFA
jgi:hypothetical protein